MKIGIIGAGFIGRALAAHAVRAGHEVMISNSRGPRTLGSTAAGIGCAIGTVADAADFGEVVIVAIPFDSITTLPADLLAGKIVIDANNYYPQRDGQIASLDRHEATTSELVQAHLSGSKVVKAFNAILARDLDRDTWPADRATRRALPIAGEDTAAKQVVAGLLDQFGFDTVDAGPLSEGWRFERAKPAYCIPLDADQLRERLAAAERDVDAQQHGAWREES